jgi:DNA-binding NtrC family response regulator
MIRHVLVIAGQRATRERFAHVLTDAGYFVESADAGADAYLRLDEGRYHAVVIDAASDADAEMLPAVKRRCGGTPLIVAGAHASMEAAVEAIHAGASDYLTTPVDDVYLRQVIARATERRRCEALADVPSCRESDSSAIGSGRAMAEVYNTVARVAPTRATVTILGETGTGKELIARALHQHSRRVARPFVTIDCGALPESLLESELFGYERGAFTGAVGDKKGLFEQADGGTCFLDEIGDVTPLLQARLLRVLQEGEVRRVGSSKVTRVDVRIVTATNKDLRTLVRDGVMRADLYYRLRVVTIQLPPLRDRPEDIPLLAHHFLRRYAREHDRPISGIAADAMRALCSYQWPGNVRELQHVVEGAVALARHSIVMRDDLPVEIAETRRPRVESRMRAAVYRGSRDEREIPVTAG